MEWRLQNGKAGFQFHKHPVISAGFREAGIGRWISLRVQAPYDTSCFPLLAVEHRYRELSMAVTRGAKRKAEAKDSGPSATSARRSTRRHMVRQVEAEKEACGICLCEEVVEQGKLSCCRHLFCFKCICAWAKVESRCPMCKQRICTITRPPIGEDPGKTVTVPEKKQVYEPSVEEVIAMTAASPSEEGGSGARRRFRRGLAIRGVIPTFVLATQIV